MKSNIRLSLSAALVTLSLISSVPAAEAQSVRDSYAEGNAQFEAGRYQNAFEIWKPLADRGHLDSMRSIAQLYRLGLGVEEDNVEAFKWYKRAAENGLAGAQVSVAFLLLKGEGTNEDREMAATWFRRAAQQGDPVAQYNLGLMHLNGVGVKPDREAAKDWLQRAASQGHERALAQLETIDSHVMPKTAEAEESGEQQEDAEPAQAEAKPDPDSASEPPRSGTLRITRMQDGQVFESFADRAKKTEAARAAMDEVRTRETEETADAGMTKKPEAEKPAPAQSAAEKPAMTSPDTPAMTPKITATPKPRVKPQPPQKRAPVITTVPVQTAYNAPPKAAPDSRFDRARDAYRNGQFTKAATLWGEMAADNDLPSQFWLGRLYNRGEGVQLDRYRAYALWRDAAERGHTGAATALVNLATRFTPEQARAAESLYLSGEFRNP